MELAESRDRWLSAGAGAAVLGGELGLVRACCRRFLEGRRRNENGMRVRGASPCGRRRRFREGRPTRRHHRRRPRSAQQRDYDTATCEMIATFCYKESIDLIGYCIVHILSYLVSITYPVGDALNSNNPARKNRREKAR